MLGAGEWHDKVVEAVQNHGRTRRRMSRPLTWDIPTCSPHLLVSSLPYTVKNSLRTPKGRLSSTGVCIAGCRASVSGCPEYDTRIGGDYTARRGSWLNGTCRHRVIKHLRV